MSATETRTYVGQPGTLAFDGFSGFWVGSDYELRFEYLPNATVLVYRDHLACGELLGPLVVTSKQFEQWWVREVLG